MNVAIVIDVKNDRKTTGELKVVLQAVNRLNKDGSIETTDDNLGSIEYMAILCEGLIALIHMAHMDKEKPSHESLEECIDYITKGFADTSYMESTKI